MPPTLPSTAAMAALRTLRRGTWWSVLHADLIDAADVLVDPMGDLSKHWTVLSDALALYAQRADVDSWENLRSALVGFDGALAAFFGPSGWEPT